MKFWQRRGEMQAVSHENPGPGIPPVSFPAAGNVAEDGALYPAQRVPPWQGCGLSRSLARVDLGPTGRRLLKGKERGDRSRQHRRPEKTRGGGQGGVLHVLEYAVQGRVGADGRPVGEIGRDLHPIGEAVHAAELDADSGTPSLTVATLSGRSTAANCAARASISESIN